MESELPDEAGGADVGILAAAGAPNDDLNGIGDGIVKNQEGNAAAAASCGIPKAEDGSGSGSRSSDTDAEGEEEEAEPTATTRWDVFQAMQKVTMQKVTIPGDFCAGGCADGSSNTPSLPTTLGLRIVAVDVSLPITEDQTQQLRAMSWKVDDESYHNVRGIEPGCITIANPAWEAALADLTRTVCLRLGVNPTSVRTVLDMLLMFHKGSSIDRCCNSDEDENVVGTLMIQLPSFYAGGEIRIWDDDGSNDRALDLGSGATSSDEPHSCHYLCHYSDCDFEMNEIKSGTRLMLTYSLIYQGNDTKPTARRRRLGMTSLERSLKRLPRFDRIFVMPLSKEYSSSLLLEKGIDALEVDHRGKAEAIRAAAGTDWKLMIINASRTEESEVDVGFSDILTHLKDVITETGEKDSESKNWISRVLKLGSGDELKEGEGTILAVNSIESIWGSPEIDFRTQMRPSYGNYEHSYHGDDDGYGGYGDYGTYEDYEIETREYKNTFVLAYDESCDFELKCLSGHASSNECNLAAEKIVAEKNIGLLKRLINLLESNKRGVPKLSFGPSAELIALLIGDDGLSLGDQRASLIASVMKYTRRWEQPDQVFFDSLVSAVKCVGWSLLSEAISGLMRRGGRGKNLWLSQFLVDVDFLLKLSIPSTVPDLDASVLIDNCLNDFESSVSKKHCGAFLSDTASTKIQEIIDRYGWTSMVERVVNATAKAMRLAQEVDVDSSFSIMSTMIFLAEILLKLDSMDQSSSLSFHLGDVIRGFCSRLQEERCYMPNIPFQQSSWDRIAVALRLIIQYGNDDDCVDFGRWITSPSHTDGFNRLLDQLSFETDGDLCIEFLNNCDLQCLLQCKGVANFDENYAFLHQHFSHPTVQIDQMLQKFPEISQAVDSNGRIPLHHATASEYVCDRTVDLLLEANRIGVSRVDPVTGLYPFMLASTCKNDDVGIAFKLLVADPSLVGGALDSDGKKRKRSPSMDDKEE